MTRGSPCASLWWPYALHAPEGDAQQPLTAPGRRSRSQPLPSTAAPHSAAPRLTTPAAAHSPFLLASPPSLASTCPLPPGKDAEHHKFGGWVAESKATQERRRRDTYEREEIDAHKMAIAAATAASDTAMTAAGGIDVRESTRKRSSIFSLLSS